MHHAVATLSVPRRPRPLVRGLLLASLVGAGVACWLSNDAAARGPKRVEQAAAAAPNPEPGSLRADVGLALFDGRAKDAALARLRARGPEGLRELLALAASPEAARWARAEAWDEVIDAVAGQRLARHSGLYWHTDLSAALARARAEDKPVLSLRLLGRLDEDLSCANSRLFRTLLYPHPEVQRALREDFVLHWSSERPAPKLTIELGDGRSLQTTITGNSAHYLLDHEGRVFDVLPGLWTAPSFARELAASHAAWRRIERLPRGRRAEAIAHHHERELERTAQALGRELAAVRWTGALPDPQALADWLAAPPAERAGLALQAAPPAEQAARLAVGKMAMEAPVLDGMGKRVPRRDRRGATAGDPSGPSGPGGGYLPTDDELDRLAALRRGQAAIDPAAWAVVVATDPLAALPPEQREPWFAALRERLVDSLARDDVKNAYELRPVTRSWLAAAWRTGDGPTLDALNARVYAELFLTPADDPWIGLYDPATFNGLPRAGLAAPPERLRAR